MVAPSPYRYKHILGETPIIDMYKERVEVKEESVGKAGVLPFYVKPDGTYMFYLMRPQALHLELGPPELQIAKGTRRIRHSGKWRDVSLRDFPIRDLSRAEDILVTAIREGAEEIGLRTDNIQELYWGKVFAFASASMGGEKYMMVFAANIIDPEAFEEPDDITAKTGECRWVSLKESETQARDDHYSIINEIHTALIELKQKR